MRSSLYFFTFASMITKSTIKLVQSLKQAKYRKEHRLFVAEGRKTVEELLNSSFTVTGLYATEAFLQQFEIRHPLLETVSTVQMEQMSGLDTPPGILAIANIPERSPQLPLTDPFALVLDGIANPGNMGTIIRTAEWFGVSNIICSEDCVEIWNPKVIQAAMGSLFRVHVVSCDLELFLKQEKAQGKAVYGALLEGENLFKQEQWTEGVMVIGSESHGIRAHLLPFITHPITIPRAMGSMTESLNASIAAGIILSRWASQNNY